MPHEVHAHISTDDYNLDFSDVDATPWFEQASEEQLRDLIQHGYDEPGERTDAIAEFLREYDLRVRDLFRYLAIVNQYRRKDQDLIGFSCTIVEDDAIGWIAEHWPVLYDTYYSNESTS